MATKRQLEANRRNAQKCTGPRTPEGKAVSSQNAVKTGIDSKAEVMYRESRDNYELLIAEYYGQFNPQGVEERFFVDTLIKAEWLSRRYMAASAIWEDEFDDTSASSRGRTFDRRSESLCRIQRCMTAVRRDFQEALNQLHTLQANREATTLTLPEPATLVRAATAAASQSYVDPQPLNPQLDSFLTPNSRPEDVH